MAEYGWPLRTEDATVLTKLGLQVPYGEISCFSTKPEFSNYVYLLSTLRYRRTDLSTDETRDVVEYHVNRVPKGYVCGTEIGVPTTLSSSQVVILQLPVSGSGGAAEKRSTRVDILGKRFICKDIGVDQYLVTRLE